MPPARKTRSSAANSTDHNNNHVFNSVVVFIFEMLPLVIIFAAVLYGGFYLWSNSKNTVTY